MHYLYGFILSVVIAGIAYKKRALQQSGFLAAIMIGTLLYGFANIQIYILLMAFFISSSLITKIKKDIHESKGRKAVQVFANASAALIFSFLYMKTLDHMYLVITAISIAAANADTWASEIGRFSKKDNRSILTFKKIQKGESGGITLLGTIASLGGSFLIAGIYILLYSLTIDFHKGLLINSFWIMIGGFLGSIIDSYLGIIIQEKYEHPKTKQKIEKDIERDQFKLISGIKYVNNDIVNFISTLLVSSAFYLLLI